MTVKDLIALLNKMPADASVIVNNSDYGYCAPSDIFMDDDGEVVIELD